MEAFGKLVGKWYSVLKEKLHEYRTEQSAYLRLRDCRLRGWWWSAGWDSGKSGSESAFARGGVSLRGLSHSSSLFSCHATPGAETTGALLTQPLHKFRNAAESDP